MITSAQGESRLWFSDNELCIRTYRLHISSWMVERHILTVITANINTTKTSLTMNCCGHDRFMLYMLWVVNKPQIICMNTKYNVCPVHCDQDVPKYGINL